MSPNFGETDIGGDMSTARPRTVTNEDLRNDLTRLTQIVRDLTAAITELKDANRTGSDARRADDLKLAKIEGALSVLRWATGLVATVVGAACVWTFNNLTEATNMNRTQEIRIINNEQTNHAQDIRLQALERGQFAEHIKGDR